MAIDVDACVFVKVPAADRHCVIVCVEDREFLCSALFVESTQRPKSRLRRFDVCIFPVPTGECPNKFSIRRQPYEIFAAECCAISSLADINTILELRIELELNGFRFAFFDQDALSLQHDSAFGGCDFQCPEKVSS